MMMVSIVGRSPVYLMPNDWTRYNNPEKRLAELRHKGTRNSKHTLLIVDRVTPSIREYFGDKFMILHEGGGLYAHKFDRVFATIVPEYDKYSAWWREVVYRSDTKMIEFM